MIFFKKYRAKRLLRKVRIHQDKVEESIRRIYRNYYGRSKEWRISPSGIAYVSKVDTYEMLLYSSNELIEELELIIKNPQS